MTTDELYLLALLTVPLGRLQNTPSTIYSDCQQEPCPGMEVRIVEERWKVILCGSAAFTTALLARLSEAPWLELVPFDASQPSAAQNLTALFPDVVLFDLADPYAQNIASLSMQRAGLPVIGLDLHSEEARMWFRSVLMNPYHEHRRSGLHCSAAIRGN